MRQLIERLEKYIKPGIMTNIYFWLLRLFSKCKICYDGYFYPQYGVAPHRHNFKNYLGTNSFFGTTRIKDKKEWPDNYDDVDDGCGVYYCTNPKCKNHISNKFDVMVKKR